VTLGLFEGWVRALLTSFVAAIGSMAVTSLELGFIESEMTSGVSMLPDAQTALEPTLGAIAMLFSVAMLAVIVAAILVGSAFRLRRGPRAIRETAPAISAPAHITAPGWFALEPASRADVVVDAVRRLSRQDEARATFTRPMMETYLQSRGRTAGRSGGEAVSESRSSNLGRRTSPSQTSVLQRREPPQ
jgi:type IV secretion system protein VirB6